MRWPLPPYARRLPAMLFLACLFALPGTANAEPVAPEEAEEAIGFAQDAFIFGDYAIVVERLRDLLLPDPPALAPDLLREGLTILGVSAFFTGEPELADAAFLALLRSEPRARLDPLLYPAQVIRRLEDVRARHADELRESHPEERGEEGTIFVETRLREQPLLVSMMPFGYGFFAMERDTLGLAYLLGQAALGTTSATLFILNENARDDRGFFPDADRAERRQRVQIGTGIAFFSMVALNALHGALLHPRQGRVEYRTLTAPPEGLTLPPSTDPPGARPR